MLSAESGRPLIENITTSLENGVNDKTSVDEGDELIENVSLPHGVMYLEPPTRSKPEVKLVDVSEHVMGAQGVES